MYNWKRRRQIKMRGYATSPFFKTSPFEHVTGQLFEAHKEYSAPSTRDGNAA